MISDKERREVAARFRALDYSDLQESLICAYLDALGIEGYADWAGIAHRLADLIDPTCEAHRNVLFYPATGLTGEHEEAVFMCGKCGEIVSYDEDYDPETDLPAYCERCGSRITGIGEPWDE